MKKILALFVCLALVSGMAFGYDGGGVTEVRKFEVIIGIDYLMNLEIYDNDGEKGAASGDPAFIYVPYSFSYGIIEGLEAEMEFSVDFINADAGDASGLNRPVFSVKYILPSVNLGGFADCIIPLGSEEIVGLDPEIGFDFGIAYEAEFNLFKIDTAVEYNLTFEGDDKSKQDGMTLYINPEYYVKEQLGLLLDIQYNITFNRQDEGDSVDDTEGNLLILSPGAEYVVNELIRLEASLPFSVIGRNNASLVGFSLEAVFEF